MTLRALQAVTADRDRLKALNAELLAAVKSIVDAEDEANAARDSLDFDKIKSDYDAIIRQCRAAIASATKGPL